MDEISSSSTKVKEMIALRAKVTVCVRSQNSFELSQTKLDKCEGDIADAEYQYLEETDHGNIVKGFEGYVGHNFIVNNS